MAANEKSYRGKKGPYFYRSFLKTVRRYGRVKEMELMTRYFLALKSPVTPFSFTPLGIKLMLKGKLAPEMPKVFGQSKLDAIFRKVEKMEADT
jgi:heterodisulfide reductase subunit C